MRFFDLPSRSTATKRGGDAVVVDGWSTSASERTGKRPRRRFRMKRYHGSWDIHVSIGPTNSDTARATMQMAPEQAEALADELKRLAKNARADGYDPNKRKHPIGGRRKLRAPIGGGDGGRQRAKFEVVE